MALCRIGELLLKFILLYPIFFFMVENVPVTEIFVFLSHFSMKKDSPVLEVELDVDEMAKNHKA